MRTIPVLDLKKGGVVHAIKGQREQYQPVKSVLASSAEPLEVVRSLMAETQCQEIYIADLDAIQGKSHNRKIINMIARHFNVNLWVDEGITDIESASRLFEAGADVVIIGSETLTSIEALKRISETLNPDQIVFSLDLKDGKVLSCAKDLKGVNPIEALKLIAPLGIERFILLTLDVVGSGQGPDLELLNSARHYFPEKRFFVGGGVKSPGHLNELSRGGAAGALVATSLHKGWITGRDIEALK